MPTSSATSRATAASADSPGSTNPARMENRPGGQTAWRPSSTRSPSCTSMITAGSVRGKTSWPVVGSRWVQPAFSTVVAAPV